MALVYTLYRENLIQGTANTSLTGTVKIIMLTSAYTVNGATHRWLSDLTGGARVGTAQTIGTKTYTGGKFSSANPTFTAVTVGSTVNAVALWVDTGVEGTSPLISYNDGISVVTNGGDITINVPAAGWAQF